jgi:hypothetical protein
MIGGSRPEGSVLGEGAIPTALVALVCGFAAVLGHAGCGATDGTFYVDDSGARPSGFCQASHFPGFPDTLGSSLFVAAIYLTPVAIVAGGTIVAAATGRREIFRVALAIAATSTLVVIAVSLALSHVGYAGAG